MNPEQQPSSYYTAHPTPHQRPAETTYPATWTSSHPTQRYESPHPASASLAIVTMNVYAIPCAYTVNNEPLYLQFGSHSAADAAQSAAHLGQRYWQMKTQPAIREDYAYSPAAVNRPARAYDPAQAPASDRYEHHESGSVPRSQPTYEFQYPSSDAQARAREYNTAVPRPVGNEMQQQQPPQPQRVYPEPEIARSVVPDIPRTPHAVVAKGDVNEQHAGSIIHATPVNRSVNYEAEDRCSDRSGGVPRVDTNVPKEQSSHHESNDIRSTSHGRIGLPDISQPNYTIAKCADNADSDRPSRSRGAKRYSDVHSNETEARAKRTRLHWTPALHESFLAAVEKLGIDNAVPTSIIREMGVEGLSRENVASHLQKHRSSLKKEKEDAEKKELLETLKSMMQSDPSNPRKNLSDEDVLKEAAAQQKIRKQEKTTNFQGSVRANPPHGPISRIPAKERRESTKANTRGHR
ncbi:Myb domain containing protein [Gracilaria domingensis]|nr:Myb domain containing protein [Gracilaria domingensis]